MQIHSRLRTPYRAGALAFCVLLPACSYFAVGTAPAKLPAASRTEAATAADARFWDVFHGGRYEEIPPTLELLTAAYLADPTDAVTAAHVGWLHIWRLSERGRLAQVPATITDDAVVAHKYFQEAVTLDPKEARYLGFLGAVTTAEGTVHKDEKMVRKGYYILQDSISAWPEFNLFTAGYTMSGQPADSDRYREALEMQWRTLDLCIDGRIDRANPDYSQYMSRSVETGHKRVCWNNWIAPHGFEGFFLNMGDMLVKAGDWQTAQKIYADARLSPAYAEWKYRDVLEARIQDAQSNVAAFAANRGMMVNAKYSCMACHQN
jgi:hypothetical protein